MHAIARYADVTGGDCPTLVADAVHRNYSPILGEEPQDARIKLADMAAFRTIRHQVLWTAAPGDTVDFGALRDPQAPPRSHPDRRLSTRPETLGPGSQLPSRRTLL